MVYDHRVKTEKWKMKKGRTKSIVLLCLSKNAYKDIDEKKNLKNDFCYWHIFSARKRV